MLSNLFKLDELNSNVRTEVIAGLTTFVTMAYIIFVNPKILSGAGMDGNAVFVATCLAAAIGLAVMGLWANWPIAMAPGMGLNAFFAFTVVGKLGYTWQQALGAVFISGVVFLLLSLTGAGDVDAFLDDIDEAVGHAKPDLDLRMVRAESENDGRD
jgi:AGZA family xanthine/uracil permease-like MFS transporter